MNQNSIKVTRLQLFALLSAAAALTLIFAGKTGSSRSLANAVNQAVTASVTATESVGNVADGTARSLESPGMIPVATMALADAATNTPDAMVQTTVDSTIW